MKRLVWILLAAFALVAVADEERILDISDWQANVARNSGLFWFAHVSDTHIGVAADYEPDKSKWLEREREVARVCNGVIRPALALVTGDLVSIPNEPSFRLYREWRGLWKCPVIDVPGNHDGPPKGELFAMYVGARRHAVVAGPCRFVGFDTGPFFGTNDVAPTLDWLGRALSAEPRRLPIVFGHYPLHTSPRVPLIKPLESFEIMGEKAERLTSLMRRHRVAVYLSGHTHDAHETGDAISGTWNVVAGSVAEDGIFRVFCVDGDTVSYSSVTAGRWPVIVITSPRRHLDDDAYRITGAVRVQAKVFSDAEVKRVAFSVEKQAGEHAMKLDERGLWSAEWAPAPPPLKIVSRVLSVRATDARGRKATEKITVVCGSWQGRKLRAKPVPHASALCIGLPPGS